MDRELLERAMDVTRRVARKVFRVYPDREERIADAVSFAWEFAQTAGPDATPSTIKHYAIRRVRSGTFRGSERSIEHQRPRGRQPAQRVVFAIEDFARVGDDPAVLAQVRIDVAAWWCTLPHLKRTVARLLAAGFRTEEVAQFVGKTEGRISQMRGELLKSWREYQDG